MTSPTGARRAIQRLGDIEGDDDNTDVSSLLNPTAATWKRVIEVIYKTRVGRDPWVQEYVLHDGHCVFEIFKDGELCSKPDGGRWRYSELGPAVASAAESLPRVTLQLLDHYSTQGSEPLQPPDCGSRSPARPQKLVSEAMCSMHVLQGSIPS
jgi:hypothetical protein